MNLILGNKKKKKIIIKILLLAAIGYVGYILINQQMLIKEKKEKLAVLSENLLVQQMKNEEIRKALENGDDSDLEYIERVAHNNLHLARHGERIFMNSAGN